MAIVMSRMTLCRAMPRAMIAVSSDSADMPLYMSLPMSRQAADSREQACWTVAHSVCKPKMVAYYAGLGAVCGARQRSLRSLCLAGLPCAAASRSTAKQVWCTSSCIRLGLQAWVGRTRTAALMQGTAQPCSSWSTCSCGPMACVCRTWTAALMQARRSPCCFFWRRTAGVCMPAVGVGHGESCCTWGDDALPRV